MADMTTADTSQQILIDWLAAAIASHMTRRIPIAVDLWSVAEISAYLKVSPRQVVERYACLPGFPAAIRLPTQGRGRGHPRYKAAEIIKWAEAHGEK